MPFDSSFESGTSPVVSVVASATVELSGLGCTCSSTTPGPPEIPDGLKSRANQFWEDGHPLLAELIVLADATGTLADSQIDGFLSSLRSPVRFEHLPLLETEPDDERAAIHVRLARLATDARLRTRYVRLQADLWETFADRWRDSGLAQVQQAVTAWEARLDAGADPIELLPERHIARRVEPYATMVRRWRSYGGLQLAPSLAAAGHIVDLPGRLSLSGTAMSDNAVVSRRVLATEIAERLKALADPTRLTILAQLGERPAAVGELAGLLHIAQPTASVHLRQLREAGLVDMRRNGARTIYSVRPEAVERLLGDVSTRLVSSLAGGRER